MTLFGDIAPDALLEFAVISTLIEITPGPNMTYLAMVAATEGRRRGYAAVAGVCLGLAMIGLAAAYGLAGVIADNPVIYQALRWGGVAYLLWLAWDGWRGAAAASEHAALGSSYAKFFRRGLITNLLNPKAALFYLSVLPRFVDPAQNVLGQTVTLTLVYVTIATLVHAAIVTAAGVAQHWLDQPARERIVRRVLSVGLVGVAVWFAVKS